MRLPQSLAEERHKSLGNFPGQVKLRFACSHCRLALLDRIHQVLDLICSVGIFGFSLSSFPVWHGGIYVPLPSFHFLGGIVDGIYGSRALLFAYEAPSYGRIAALPIAFLRSSACVRAPADL